jgi:hypothetical protein
MSHTCEYCGQECYCDFEDKDELTKVCAVTGHTKGRKRA